jgi:hypothetical protein
MTALTAAQLADLRAQGHAAPRPRFVDPGEIHRAKEILTRRGEGWATEILGRDLSARSRVDPRFPWLTSADLATLLLADVEEDRAAFGGIVGGGSE